MWLQTLNVLVAPPAKSILVFLLSFMSRISIVIWLIWSTRSRVCDNTYGIYSVSISACNTMIASGSSDNTIHLWKIGTGECHVMEGHSSAITIVSFSPINSQLLLSVSNDGAVQKWGIDGHQIGSPITGSHVAFSPDGTQFVSCEGTAVTIWNTDSGETITVFHLDHASASHCCFSPDGGFIACAAHHTIYLWDITSPDPHLVKTFVGHAGGITSLVFSSSLTLISASEDRSIKFWDIGVSLANPVVHHTESISLTSAPIRAVSLQAKDGLAFSVDSAGVVRTWCILTGHCKESLETQAKDIFIGDMQLIGGRLVIAGCKGGYVQGWTVHIWDAKNGELQIHTWAAEDGELQTMDVTSIPPRGLRISGDGSRVFCVDDENIQAWSIQTGVPTGRASLRSKHPYLLDPLWIDGLKVLVCCSHQL